MHTDYKGIDYGMGLSNISEEGIRYGVISANKVAGWILDILVPVYSSYCPECTKELTNKELEDMKEDICPYCEKSIDLTGDEPSGWISEDPDLDLFYDQDTNDIWILKSKVAVNAQFCSPCAPGAGYIANICKEGPLTYALPLDLFDEFSPAPYSQEELIEL